MRLHATRRRLRRSTDGQQAVALGLRAGYWPCLKAPFVQATVGPYIASVWLSSQTWDCVPPGAPEYEAFDLGRTFSSAAERAAARAQQREGWR